MGGPVIGCGGGSSCDQVLSSRWSSIGGKLPISGLAAGAYLAMLAASLFIGPATEASVRGLAWRAMFVLAWAAAGSAVWFTILQKWVIGAFCPYCMTTHITGLLLAALISWRALTPFDDDSADAARMKSSAVPQRAIGRLPAAGLALAGLAFAGILAACQIRFAPPAVYRDGNAADNLQVIDPHNAPLIGSPDARYVVALLFDYNCPHCQQLHLMLDEAIRRYGGKLAFVLCPTPLNTRCNPYVPRDLDEFKTSCDLARIGLTVWVARREAFPEFDRWMFSFETGDRWQPRSPDAARARAIELVGQSKFDAAQADPWIDQYLQTSLRSYAATLAGGNAVPKLLFGSRWVIPQPDDADDLLSILHDSLSVPRP